jgi:hypothetical protein
VILDAPYFGNDFEKILEILIGHIRICRYKIFYFNMLICEKCGKYPGDQYILTSACLPAPFSIIFPNCVIQGRFGPEPCHRP